MADEVDLVDRQHDVADAEQRHDGGVAARLRQEPLAGVDQQDGEVGVGRPGGHVARELFVAGRVGHHEGALGGRKVPVGDVDGDALFALGFEAVDEEREVDVVAHRAVLLRVALQRGQLVVEDRLLFEQEAADQGRLAVVDRAAGEEAQGRQRVCGGRGARVGGHQKYPSRFFFSMEPASSASMRRPWRSEVVEPRISPSTASSVSASDSTAPVSG
jgi:hypothetical protein